MCVRMKIDEKQYNAMVLELYKQYAEDCEALSGSGLETIDPEVEV